MKYLVLVLMLVLYSCEENSWKQKVKVVFANNETTVCTGWNECNCGMRYYNCEDHKEHRCETNSSFERIK